MRRRIAREPGAAEFLGDAGIVATWVTPLERELLAEKADGVPRLPASECKLLERAFRRAERVQLAQRSKRLVDRVSFSGMAVMQASPRLGAARRARRLSVRTGCGLVWYRLHAVAITPLSRCFDAASAQHRAFSMRRDTSGSSPSPRLSAPLYAAAPHS
jgi:hypothetical protein